MSLEKLCKAVEAGEQEGSKELAQALVDERTDPLDVIAALIDVMGGIGEKFSRLEIFVPEMMLAG
jgi:5-methyltetrahydrofolate--homocysteine methyltransferase